MPAKKIESISKTTIKKHIEQVNEYVQSVKDLRMNKQLYFDVYDGLKGFDLIMSILGKEALITYLSGYMKDSDSKTKNYAHFLVYINNQTGDNFLHDLKAAHDGILEQYHTIKFSPKAHHFGTEEMYLKETLNQIKSSLEGLGEFSEKNKFMKLKLSFLNTKNSSLNFRFTDTDLEKVAFYEQLSELDDEASASNLLPFFRFMSKCMTKLKAMQVRINAAAQEFMVFVEKDIDALQKKYDAIEAKALKDSGIKIGVFLKNKELKNVSELREQIDFSLNDVIRKKDIIQSTITKDIEELESSLMELKETL